MKESGPTIVKLEEYAPSPFLVTDVFLTFDLDETKTLVKSLLKIKRNEILNDSVKELILDGSNLKLISLKLDGELLTKDQFSLTAEKLYISVSKNAFSLEIENEINPTANTALQGLYRSGNIFCTQNEPEGFRRITYFIDRPDIMAKYTTKIIADKKQYPILLSNGNPISSGDLDNGKHFVEWYDPFFKPSYLFALVAGDLDLLRDEFITKSNRNIDLRIYSDKGNKDKCKFAMESLKKAMKWDEDTFGLEYDLDIYMIVAVDAFNMGAMENKGLNIFNSSAVLANPDIATDDNYHRIESIIAHEYFHNWTGNRVTCRDWFQLTLKEGLTVFRDQEFSSDLHSRPVQRIRDVQSLKERQFPEDDGPTAHPIRPSSYMEINNFYTATIYEKGAEVIRMIHTLVGQPGFRRGMDKYFELYDGKAVTTEDFIYAMEVANNIDLTQFKNWYSQFGTPRIEVESSFDEKEKTFSLNIKQLSPETLHFPLKVGLIDDKGKDISFNEETSSLLKKGILEVKKREETFHFKNVNKAPYLSINRDFSAPIKINWNPSMENQIFLLTHDSNGFNRYEAAQDLANKIIQGEISSLHGNKKIDISEEYISAFGKLLDDKSIDSFFKSLCLQIPSEGVLLQDQEVYDFDGTHVSRDFLKKVLAKTYKEKLSTLYKDLSTNKKYTLESKDVSNRALKNTVMSFLSYLEEDEIYGLIKEQFDEANNMTDKVAALQCLVQSNSPLKKAALDSFYLKWNKNHLVMEKWFAIQASSPQQDTYSKIYELEGSPVYDKTIPNLVRALWGTFTSNYVHFHHKSGRGYALIARKILELDPINPQVSSALAKSFRHYKKLMPENKRLMQLELEKIRSHVGISKNVLEIVTKTLA
jgi:aminopeptidase N